VFFLVTYGDLTAFLYGWTTFIVYQTGSIAAIAVAFARYFGYFVDLPHLSPALEAWKLPLIGNIYPLKDIGVSLVAISSILLLAGVNYFGVHIGGFVQDIFPFLPVVGSACVRRFVERHRRSDDCNTLVVRRMEQPHIPGGRGERAEEEYSSGARARHSDHYRYLRRDQSRLSVYSPDWRD